jgi:hypothetical protein
MPPRSGGDGGGLLFLSDNEMTSISEHWYILIVEIFAKTLQSKIFRSGWWETEVSTWREELRLGGSEEVEVE